MTGFTNPESVMANYGLSLGALPGLECMVTLEKLCQSVRKSGLESAEIERALRMACDDLWEKIQQVYAERDGEVYDDAYYIKAKRQPQPVTVSFVADDASGQDPFTSW